MAIPGAVTSESPTWMLNHTLTGVGKWHMLPTKLLLPCQVPVGLARFGSVWEVTGAPEGLLSSAVREGVWLSAKILEFLQKELGFPLPDKRMGSGKGGSLVKADYAAGLVKHLWPEASEAEHVRMVDSLVGSTVSKVKCPRDVIAAVKELGLSEGRDFEHLQDIALNQEAVERERSQRGPDIQQREEQKTFTPVQLSKLLPPSGGNRVACNRNPLLSRYQAFYSGVLAELKLNAMRD